MHSFGACFRTRQVTLLAWLHLLVIDFWQARCAGPLLCCVHLTWHPPASQRCAGGWLRTLGTEASPQPTPLCCASCAAQWACWPTWPPGSCSGKDSSLLPDQALWARWCEGCGLLRQPHAWVSADSGQLYPAPYAVCLRLLLFWSAWPCSSASTTTRLLELPTWPCNACQVNSGSTILRRVLLLLPWRSQAVSHTPVCLGQPALAVTSLAVLDVVFPCCVEKGSSTLSMTWTTDCVACAKISAGLSRSSSSAGTVIGSAGRHLSAHQVGGKHSCCGPHAAQLHAWHGHSARCLSRGVRLSLLTTPLPARQPALTVLGADTSMCRGASCAVRLLTTSEVVKTAPGVSSSASCTPAIRW